MITDEPGPQRGAADDEGDDNVVRSLADWIRRGRDRGDRDRTESDVAGSDRAGRAERVLGCTRMECMGCMDCMGCTGQGGEHCP